MESITIKTAEDIAGMRIAGRLAQKFSITLPLSSNPASQPANLTNFAMTTW
jgi:methionine aminopeptidase